eukprot:10420202-Alexandrium_andersonii.AAC.1
MASAPCRKSSRAEGSGQGAEPCVKSHSASGPLKAPATVRAMGSAPVNHASVAPEARMAAPRCSISQTSCSRQAIRASRGVRVA